MEPVAGKKILLVITKSNWGGAQVYVYALATYFAKKGAQVTVALGGTGLPNAPVGLLSERLTAEGIRCIYVSSFTRDISSAKEFKALKEIRHIIREVRPDILHLNSSKAGGIGALAGRLERVPKIIFTAHGWAYREPRSWIKKTLIWISSWVTVFFCHTIIVVSRLDQRDAPVFLSHKKIKVVQNGIPLFPLLSRQEARKLLTEMGVVDTGGIWILMTSELHKNKAVDTAINAFKKIISEYPDTKLIVVNQGEERTNLESLITESHLRDNVFLVGFVSNARSYLKAADIFLLSSLKEGLPMGVLEAGISGLPIIASDTGGIPEVIHDRQTGLLATPGDIDSFATALRLLLGDEELRNTLGEKAALYIKENFSEERMLQQTESLYLTKN